MTTSKTNRPKKASARETSTSLDVDLLINKESDDYKLALQARRTGKQVSLEGKSKEEIMRLLGRNE